MDNELKKVYDEEIVRAKARYDFNNQTNKNKKKPKRINLYQALAISVYLLLGSIGIYALYRTYLVFM